MQSVRYAGSGRKSPQPRRGAPELHDNFLCLRERLRHEASLRIALQDWALYLDTMLSLMTGRDLSMFVELARTTKISTSLR